MFFLATAILLPFFPPPIKNIPINPKDYSYSKDIAGVEMTKKVNIHGSRLILSQPIKKFYICTPPSHKVDGDFTKDSDEICTYRIHEEVYGCRHNPINDAKGGFCQQHFSISV